MSLIDAQKLDLTERANVALLLREMGLEELQPYFDDVPNTVAGSITAWLAFRRKPGGFVTACLMNNFVAAAVKADRQNAEHLPQIARLIANLPSGSWGQGMSQWKGLIQ